jgi:hypothetical protein
VAKKWDAAVELMCVAEGGKCPGEQALISHAEEKATETTKSEYDGGIQDDTETKESFSAEVARSLDELVKCGCSGGHSTFYGTPDSLITSLQRRSTYSMVVLGDLFLDKGEATRVRLKSELKGLFSDRLSVPVVEDTELHQQFTFGIKQITTLVLSVAAALALFLGVFSYQRELLNFLTGEEFKHLRAVAVVVIAVLTPLFAFTYGTFTRQLLKLFRLD